MKYKITLTKSLNVEASNEDEARAKAEEQIAGDSEALTASNMTWTVEEVADEATA